MASPKLSMNSAGISTAVKMYLRNNSELLKLTKDSNNEIEVNWANSICTLQDKYEGNNDYRFVLKGEALIKTENDTMSDFFQIEFYAKVSEDENGSPKVLIKNPIIHKL